MSSIRIYNVYFDNKKDYELLETDIIKPIQAGRATAQREIKGMRGDDTGENISLLNNHLNEFTAMYWAWKNDKESDYIGFFHYRRHFSFKDSLRYYKNPLLDQVYEEMNDYYFSQTSLKNSSLLRETISKNDAILGYPSLIKESYIRRTLPFIFSPDMTKEKNLSPMEEAYRIIEERDPSFKKAIKEHRRKKQQYLYCLFILKRELFDEMCAWLFPVLLEVQDSIDYSSATGSEIRMGGYVGERLIDFYLTYLVEEREVKTHHLAKTFILNLEEPKGEITKKSDYDKIIEPSIKMYFLNFLRKSFDTLFPFNSRFRSWLKRQLRK